MTPYSRVGYPSFGVGTFGETRPGPGGRAASVRSSPNEGSPVLRLGSGRWQARHLAGQFVAGEMRLQLEV